MHFVTCLRALAYFVEGVTYAINAAGSGVIGSSEPLINLDLGEPWQYNPICCVSGLVRAISGAWPMTLADLSPREHGSLAQF